MTPMTGVTFAYPIQQAAFDLLTGDAAITALVGVGGVFVGLDENRPLPYVSIPGQQELGAKIIGSGGTRNVMQIDIYAATDDVIYAIYARIVALLSGATLTIAGAQMVSATTDILTMQDPTGARHGVVRYRTRTLARPA